MTPLHLRISNQTEKKKIIYISLSYATIYAKPPQTMARCKINSETVEKRAL